MDHVGRLWVEADGEASASLGSVSISDGQISVEMASVPVGSWPVRNVVIEPAGFGTFTLVVSNRRLGFEPIEPAPFAEEARAVTLSNELAVAATPAGQAIGVPLEAAQRIAPAKNPGVAAALSFLWTGAGQMYNGNFVLGVVFMVLQVINVLLMFFFIGFITFFAVWLWGVVEAYRGAEAHNRRRGFA
jgi:TM2 domain-containing membrane protein YozV